MNSKTFWKNFCGWVMLMSGLLILLFLYFYIPMIISNPTPASEGTIQKQDIIIGVLAIADVVFLYFAVKWIWQTERLFKEDDEVLETGNKN